MPAYLYQCVQCQAQEARIGGLDDHLAICASCRHMMLRLDRDLFGPYFSSPSDKDSSLHRYYQNLTQRR